MSGLAEHIERLDRVVPYRFVGRVAEMSGLTVGVADFPVPIGSMCRIGSGGGARAGVVVGFRGSRAVVMPLGELAGVAPGDRVVLESIVAEVGVGDALLGRVIDAMGRPIDGCGPVATARRYPLVREAPGPLERVPIREPIATGVRCIDAMTTVGKGQRLGIFAGTGVGKSVLIGMIARASSADVNVVALVGERGREVRDFLERDLGPQGRRRSVVVVSTGDESPVLRVRASFVATAVAEYFREAGCDVLLIVDSLTRLAMAQRQIGLAAGEPPATKGYPPSAFAMLAPLLERAGRTARGSITGLYSVLVEGDDITEPVSDAIRGVLDGHIWLSRTLAGRKHYPAMSVLESISRVMVDVVDEAHYRAAARVQQVLAAYAEVEELVTIGAYVSGSNPMYDVAIAMKPRIDAFLRQDMYERSNLEEARAGLVRLVEEIEAEAERLGAGQSGNLSGGGGGASPGAKAQS